ncbi:MAG TPA: hypothetical protein H9751_01295 [Candidatus Corynebacterium faecigallinarum]|uniref:Uncharacterized protein n=1 Tax=Candidatus Corynebacterium faecigallinarum TaxID=2838528 RepID=A0A9D2TN15_9CORY|nr:hypothetical protein [Candidatus Corynebacterium faecigallinarum]
MTASSSVGQSRTPAFCVGAGRGIRRKVSVTKDDLAVVVEAIAVDLVDGVSVGRGVGLQLRAAEGDPAHAGGHVVDAQDL